MGSHWELLNLRYNELEVCGGWLSKYPTVLSKWPSSATYLTQLTKTYHAILHCKYLTVVHTYIWTLFYPSGLPPWHNWLSCRKHAMQSYIAGFWYVPDSASLIYVNTVLSLIYLTQLPKTCHATIPHCRTYEYLTVLDTYIWTPFYRSGLPPDGLIQLTGRSCDTFEILRLNWRLHGECRF